MNESWLPFCPPPSKRYHNEHNNQFWETGIQTNYKLQLATSIDLQLATEQQLRGTETTLVNTEPVCGTVVCSAWKGLRLVAAADRIDRTAPRSKQPSRPAMQQCSGWQYCDVYGFCRGK